MIAGSMNEPSISETSEDVDECDRNHEECDDSAYHHSGVGVDVSVLSLAQEVSSADDGVGETVDGSVDHMPVEVVHSQSHVVSEAGPTCSV